MRLPFILKFEPASSGRLIYSWLLFCLLFMPAVAWQEKNLAIAYAGLLSAGGTVSVYGQWRGATKPGLWPATVIWPLFAFAAVLSYQPPFGWTVTFINGTFAALYLPELYRILVGPSKPPVCSE